MTVSGDEFPNYRGSGTQQPPSSSRHKIGTALVVLLAIMA